VEYPRLLTLAQAAERLNYSQSYVRRLVKDGKILFQQVGKNAPIRFRPEWVEQFIDETTVEPIGHSATPARRQKNRAVDEFDRSVFLN
jgi:excisionase family DNA binding protein